MGSHYLPPDRGDVPAINPAEAGTRFIDPSIQTSQKFSSKLRSYNRRKSILDQSVVVWRLSGHGVLLLWGWRILVKGKCYTILKFLLKHCLKDRLLAGDLMLTRRGNGHKLSRYRQCLVKTILKI